MLLLLVSFTLVALGNCMAPKYCCYPPQFEGNQGILTGSVDDEGHAAVTTGMMGASFDTVGQRIHMDDRLSVGNESKHYIILQLYKQHYQYIIEGTTCTKAPLPPWSPSTYCIPDNASLAQTYVMGGKQNITVWEYHYMAANLDFYVGVTNDCMLVTSKMYGEINGEKTMLLLGFQGATLGIRDPTIFDVPAICQHAPLLNPPKVLRRRLSVFRH